METLIYVVILGMVASFVENIRSLNSIRDAERDGTVAVLYQCLNFHLPMSIGVAVYLWQNLLGKGNDAAIIIPTILVIFGGAISKAVVSDATPERLFLNDKVTFLGMWLPNAIAGSFLAYAAFRV